MRVQHPLPIGEGRADQLRAVGDDLVEDVQLVLDVGRLGVEELGDVDIPLSGVRLEEPHMLRQRGPEAMIAVVDVEVAGLEVHLKASCVDYGQRPIFFCLRPPSAFLIKIQHRARDL